MDFVEISFIPGNAFPYQPFLKLSGGEVLPCWGGLFNLVIFEIVLIKKILRTLSGNNDQEKEGIEDH